jgi:DNA-binding response OmpR family regulator
MTRRPAHGKNCRAFVYGIGNSPSLAGQITLWSDAAPTPSVMPSAKRILLVDENSVPRHSLAEQLSQHAAYEVIEADSVAQARAATDIVFAIIDAGIEGGKGESLADELRENGFTGPVLLLTADPPDPAIAHEQMLKPFRLATLLARLAATLGPHGGDEDRAFQIGPYLFQPGAKLLTGARKIRLTEKETNILKFLHSAGRTVPRETLLHEVWGYSPAVTTHTLETHIYRLRRKIEDDPGRAKILVTEGGGYRLGGLGL